MKTNCNKCGTRLIPTTNWAPTSQKYGVYRCNTCKVIAAREYRAANHEACLARARVTGAKWRAANRLKTRAAVKSWRQRNPEKLAEYAARAKKKYRADKDND
jgi:hypothetical protein